MVVASACHRSPGYSLPLAWIISFPFTCPHGLFVSYAPRPLSPHHSCTNLSSLVCYSVSPSFVRAVLGSRHVRPSPVRFAMCITVTIPITVSLLLPLGLLSVSPYLSLSYYSTNYITPGSTTLLESTHTTYSNATFCKFVSILLFYNYVNTSCTQVYTAAL